MKVNYFLKILYNCKVLKLYISPKKKKKKKKEKKCISMKKSCIKSHPLSHKYMNTMYALNVIWPTPYLVQAIDSLSGN